MSHDRGCPCGRERYDYAGCLRADCGKREKPAAAAPPPTPDDLAKREIAMLCAGLMLRGIQPHVIGAALLASLTLTLCSASPTVAAANLAMNEAVKALRSNRRLVPTLVAQASAGRHAAQPAVTAGRQ